VIQLPADTSLRRLPVSRFHFFLASGSAIPSFFIFATRVVRFSPRCAVATCRTRSSLGCNACGTSPISSRNSVPHSLCWQSFRGSKTRS